MTGNSFEVTPTPDPQARDAAAARLIDAYASTELARVRVAAEKWTAGLAALITVISASVVVKGPESFDPLRNWARYLTIGLMAVGAAALGYGIFSAYQATAGSPTKRSALDDLVESQRELEGTANAWRHAVQGLVKESRSKLKAATVFTTLAAVAFALAIGLAWLGPKNDASSAKSCILTSTGTAQFNGDLPEVSSGSVTVTACRS